MSAPFDEVVLFSWENQARNHTKKDERGPWRQIDQYVNYIIPCQHNSFENWDFNTQGDNDISRQKRDFFVRKISQFNSSLQTIETASNSVSGKVN